MNEIFIVIGNPDNPNKKEYFFIDFLASLYNYLLDNNFNVKLIWKAIDVNPNIDNLHIGIFNMVTNMPKNYIMFNIEPLENRDEIYNKKLINSKAILNLSDEYGFPKDSCYFHKNITFPITYHPIIENIFGINKNYDEEIDVLFYGSMNERRIELVNKIKSNGINIYCPNQPISNDYPDNVFGKEKDILIEKSKIILLSVYYEKSTEIPRSIYCLSKKKCIIADSYGDNYKLKEYFDNVFPVVETENIIETINFYLKNDLKRKDIAEKGYNYVKEKYKTKNFVGKIIEIINNY